MLTKVLGQADWRNDQRVVADHHEVDTEVDILDSLEFPETLASISLSCA